MSPFNSVNESEEKRACRLTPQSKPKVEAPEQYPLWNYSEFLVIILTYCAFIQSLGMNQLKRLLLLLIGFLPLMSLGEDSIVYVTAGDFLDRYRISKTGEVTREMHHELDNGPGGIAISSNEKYLFVSKGKSVSADSYGFDLKAGQVGEKISATPIDKWSEGIYFSPSRKTVFVPCYTSSRLVQIGIGENGSLNTEPLSVVETGNGPHDIVWDRSHRYFYIPFLKDNTIGIYSFEPETDRFMPHPEVAVYDGKVEGFDPKTGPRHLLFHPTLDILYSHNQMNATIYAYDHNPETGLLSPRQGVQVHPDRIDSKPNTGGGGLEMSRDAKNLYICSRSHHYLTHVRLDDSGDMRVISDLDTVEGPRVLKLSQNGKWLFVAGQTSGKLGILKVDPETGKLTPHREIDCGGKVPWLLVY